MENIHPGILIQQALIKRGRTQKDFAHILNKKVSEVNELIKGKRNITIQRDILLETIFDTQAKYWINKQMEYDYQIHSQSVDMQKIEDIRARKNLLQERKPEKEIDDGDVSIEEEKEIIADPIASPKESSTIQDTQAPQENKPPQQDKHKEHEIFRNF